MKYMTAQPIAIFFLVLGIKLLTEGISINNYFRLINDVHRYYRTTCVIFVWSSNYDFNTTTLVHTWSREFSRQRVMTVTVTFTDLMNEYNEYQKNVARPLFVILLDAKETMNEFAKTTRSIKPIFFPIWLVIFLQRPGNPLEKYCRYPTDNVFNVDISTQMLVLCYDRPVLVEWYALHDNCTRTFDLALWSSDKGLILNTRKNIHARRSDMFGDVLRVAFVKNSPLVSLENGTLGGFFGLVLAELSKAMNFTVKILDPMEAFGSWNHQEKMWVGAIGQLVRNEADIGVSAFTLTTRRQNIVDFTMPLARSNYRLYFKKPDISYVQWSLYLRTFSSGIWITLIMLIIIASILLTFMKTKGYFSMSLMSENYINVWGIYCQQGLPEFPSESPMRVAFLSIYISSIVILSIYSASLISFLALSSPKLPFSTLDGYVKDRSYKLIVMKNSAEYDVPSRIKDPVFLQMYELLEDKRYLPLTLAEGFEQVCDQKKLAFYTTDMFRQAVNMLRCEIVHIETGRIDNVAITLTKGNPYTGFMNYHLRRFQLNGVMNKLKNKYLRNKFSGNKTYGVVELIDIAPTLTMVAGSMVLALFILIIEIVHYSFKTRTKNNKSSVKKLSHNLDVKNKLHKRNIERSLKHRGFFNTRPIGYWP